MKDFIKENEDFIKENLDKYGTIKILHQFRNYSKEKQQKTNTPQTNAFQLIPPVYEKPPNLINEIKENPEIPTPPQIIPIPLLQKINQNNYFPNSYPPKPKYPAYQLQSQQQPSPIMNQIPIKYPSNPNPYPNKLPPPMVSNTPPDEQLKSYYYKNTYNPSVGPPTQDPTRPYIDKRTLPYYEKLPFNPAPPPYTQQYNPNPNPVHPQPPPVYSNYQDPHANFYPPERNYPPKVTQPYWYNEEAKIVHNPYENYNVAKNPVNYNVNYFKPMSNNSMFPDTNTPRNINKNSIQPPINNQYIKPNNFLDPQFNSDKGGNYNYYQSKNFQSFHNVEFSS